jgi:hypothetical protein
MECNYHHLVMSDPQDVVKYSTRSDALAALHNLVAKHAAQGYTTCREPSGRYRSSRADGRTVEFWIDDNNGDIVGSCGSGREQQGLEIDYPVPSTAPDGQGCS